MTLLPIAFGIMFLAGLRVKLLVVIAVIGDHRRAGRLDVRAEGLSEVAHRDLPGSGAGSAGRRLSADPGAHHRRVGRAGGQGIPSRARRASTSSCPSRTTISSTRCWPRSRDSWACWRRSGCICSWCCARWRRRGSRRTGTGPTSWSGLITGFTFQVVYNITMSAGLAPVKGLTLPLMSYGGSSVIATLASFGLILNVRMRRFHQLGLTVES